MCIRIMKMLQYYQRIALRMSYHACHISSKIDLPITTHHYPPEDACLHTVFIRETNKQKTRMDKKQNKRINTCRL